MTGGFATVAGTVLGAYIGYSACNCKYPIFLNSGWIFSNQEARFGIDANSLITCSFMAAPCSLAVAKLFYPETEETKTAIKVDNLKSRNRIFIWNISDDIIHTRLWNN